MDKRPLWYLLLGIVVLGLGASPSFAQSNSGSGSSDSGSSTSGSTGSDETSGGASTADDNCPPGEQRTTASAACETGGTGATPGQD